MKHEHSTETRRCGWLAAAFALAVLSGCGAMQGGGGSHERPGQPGILLSSSHLTRDGGLRIVASLETGEFRVADASIRYTLSDPKKGPPLAVPAEGTSLDLVGGTTERADVDRKDREVSFTIGKHALDKLGDRFLWYRWTVTLDGGPILTSLFYRTSRSEAGLPRAAEAPGPDTSFVVPRGVPVPR